MKKKLLILFLILGIIFLIYVKTKDNQIYYLNIVNKPSDFNDNNYYLNIIDNLKPNLEKNIEYDFTDKRVCDILNSIINNDYIYEGDTKYTIQNALIKADIVTIFMGYTDLEYISLKQEKIDIYNYIDTLLLDIDDLLEEIRKYSKEEIYILDFYDELDIDEYYIDYFKTKLIKICNENNVKLVSDYINYNSSLKFTFK